MSPSYSSRPGKLISYKTKRVYPFDHVNDRDGAKRKAAERQLAADDDAFTSAMTSRAQRDVNARELMAQRPTVTDTRSIREKVESDGHTTAAPQDPNINPWAGALDGARKKIARTPQERSAKAARIQLYEAKAAEWEQSRQRERERQEVLSRPDVAQAIDHATRRCDAMLMDPAATQAEIDAARYRLSSLQQSGDVSSYHTETQAADAAKIGRLKAEHEAAEKTLADLHAAVMAGEVSLADLPAPAAE